MLIPTQYDNWIDNSSSSEEEEEEEQLAATMKENQNTILLALQLGLVTVDVEQLPKEV